MKKIMIINYKWEENLNQNIDVQEMKNSEIKFFGYRKEKISELVKEIQGIVENNTVLVLTHNNYPNYISADEIKKLVNHSNLKVFEFKGGVGFVYRSGRGRGIIDSNDNFNNNLQPLLNSANCKIPKDNFENTWDFYWNKLDLENQKKKIINLWLPLAIDIQGLSEVQNETHKADEYFNEIKMETDYLNLLKSFPNEDFPNWEEIKNELDNGFNDFNPADLINSIEEAKSFNELNRDLLKRKRENEREQSNPNFLPNWLQEVVKVIDKKIKESSKTVEENEAAKS